MQTTRIGDLGSTKLVDDKASMTLGFEDGSIGTVHYFANGATGFPKERVEVFTAGRVLQLDNFRAMNGFNWPGFRKAKLWKQDKGQQACAAAFLNALATGKPAIPTDEIFEVADATLHIASMIREQN